MRPQEDGNGVRIERHGPKPCETPGCSENCTYAYSCHEERVGRPGAMFWPLAGLVLLIVAGVAF